MLNASNDGEAPKTLASQPVPLDMLRFNLHLTWTYLSASKLDRFHGDSKSVVPSSTGFSILRPRAAKHCE